jgi:hypothetical protein
VAACDPVPCNLTLFKNEETKTFFKGRLMITAESTYDSAFFIQNSRFASA